MPRVDKQADEESTDYFMVRSASEATARCSSSLFSSCHRFDSPGRTDFDRAEIVSLIGWPHVPGSGQAWIH